MNKRPRKVKTAREIYAELDSKLYIRPSELGALLGIPRARAYAVLKELPVTKLGPRTFLVPSDAVRVFLESK